MTDWQFMVREFHEKFGQPIGDRPHLLDWGRFILRHGWTQDEADETYDCEGADSLDGVADGLVDQIYFLLGTAVEMGIDLDPLFRAVHAANMAKVGGGTHADGKIKKPDGWQAPDIEGELRKQGWEP